MLHKRNTSSLHSQFYDDSSAGDRDVGGSVESSTSEAFVAEEEELLEEQVLAKRESIAVVRLRMLVFLVLLLSTLAVALCVYFYVSRSEMAQFEMQFQQDTYKILQSFGSALDLTLGGIDLLVVDLVSFAVHTNQQWPYVTVPDFTVRAEKTRALSKAVYVSVYPFVPKGQRYIWQNYSSIYGPQWVQQALAMQKKEGLYTDIFDELNITHVNYFNVIYSYAELNKPKSEQGKVGESPDSPGPWMPIWQTSPVIPTVGSPYNWDLLSLRNANESMVAVLDTHLVSLTEAYLIAAKNDTAALLANENEANFISYYLTSGEEPMEPVSDILYPILEDANEWIVEHGQFYKPTNHKLGGFLSITFYWRDLIKGILPQGSNGIVVVIDNPCNPTFTYQINGPMVQYLGVGDYHESRFNHLEIQSELQDLEKYLLTGASTYSGIPVNPDYCPFTVRVYPSTIMLNTYVTDNRIIFTVGTVLIFAFTSAVFLLYDCWVERRQRIVMKSAVRTNEIVASFFPSTVRERIFLHQEEKKMKEKHKELNKNAFTNKVWTAREAEKLSTVDNSLPIADFFPETTILFADLAGFTAWSSQREPAQVFIMLETLYEAFDKIAKRRGVFKIETIGDCYVAVTGLPTPRKNHAVVMARFAADIRDAMNSITPELELTLGPGTGDLLIRVGLHSGSCTGGVLRGEKCLFTLFGDTVNTASRMESNGKPNRIHCSQATADLLIEAGKQEWLTPREELITAKGKGQMQTYWVEPKGRASTSHSSDRDDTHRYLDDNAKVHSLGVAAESVVASQLAKLDRMIDWNVAVFEELVQKLIAHRLAMGGVPDDGSTWREDSERSTTPRDEMVDVISMVSHRPALEGNPETTEVPPEVIDQLHSYVSVIAHSYRPNAFHNFERASHSTMFVKKLFQRIATSKTLSKSAIDIRSFGGDSDPLAQVAIFFASLIHDVDHPGIPNAQLIREDRPMAARYKNKSVAEQHSFDVAWNLLMEPLFEDLRQCLFGSKDEMRRFRQLVVNCVLATDIFDRELRSMREQRWNEAFNELPKRDDQDIVDRKATIVLEHVCLASDVCHTMQPWSIYTKWSQALFDEMYSAYLAGRIHRDPTLNWYEGELRFFDEFVIPIATKLRDCEIFGASSREFLDCVMYNREEWKNKGRDLVEEMKESFETIKKVEI